MEKKKIKYIVTCSVCLVIFALIAVWSATNKVTDLIMPSVCIVNGVTKWYALLLGLLAETIIVKYFLKETYLKSVTVSMVMNLVSVILGFVTLHIVSLIVELLFIFFEYGTFHVSHWVVNFLLIIPMNACLEGWTAKIAFKLKFKETFVWLCLANAVSIIISFLCNLSWIGEMFF